LEWRINEFGSNEAIVKKPRTILDMVLDTFEDETMRILCVAAILSLVLGIGMHGIKEGWIEGASILLAVVIISTVTAFNDYAKEKQFRKLNEVARRKNVNVIRNG
jgi:Ca2+ transporting ATPase